MVTKEALDIILSNDEKIVFKMYEYLIKKIVDKNYNLCSDASLKNLLEYLHTNNKSVENKNLSKNENIFILTNQLVSSFYLKNITDEKKIKAFLSKSQKENKICKEVLDYLPQLNKIYTTSIQESKPKIFFKGENFEFYYLESKNNTIDDFTIEDSIFFHIILDGVAYANNKYMLSRGDVYFSTQPLLNENFISVGPDYSKIIFAIKRKFIEDINIQVIKNGTNKFYLPTIKFIEDILIQDNYEKVNEFTLVEIATYLLEFYTNNSVNLYPTMYLDYKKEVIDIIDDNIFLDKKDIVDKLLISLDVSLSKLYNISHYLFGISINKYIDKIKIDKASYLLLNTKDSIERICMKLNIPENLFVSRFIEQLECSPKEFKEYMELG